MVVIDDNIADGRHVPHIEWTEVTPYLETVWVVTYSSFACML